MAYATSGLTTVFHAPGKAGVHVYTSSDSLGTIAGSGYFNNATSVLRQGDLIIINDTDEDGIGAAFLRVSSATDAATVTTVRALGRQAVYVAPLTGSAGGTATTVLATATATYNSTVTDTNITSVAARLNALLTALTDAKVLASS